MLCEPQGQAVGWGAQLCLGRLLKLVQAVRRLRPGKL